jgi:hypothetical protein
MDNRWESHKETMRKLFLVDKKTYDEVMKTMERVVLPVHPRLSPYTPKLYTRYPGVATHPARRRILPISPPTPDP